MGEGMGQLGWEGRRTHRSTDSQSWKGREIIWPNLLLL